MKCKQMFIYLITLMHTRKVSHGKVVYLADGKNEIIVFALLVSLRIV